MRARTWRRRPRRMTPPKASRTGFGSAILSPSGKDSRRGEGAPSHTRSRDGRTSSLCAQASRAPFRTGRPAPPQASDVSTFLSCEDLVICCLAYHKPETKKSKRRLHFFRRKVNYEAVTQLPTFGNCTRLHLWLFHCDELEKKHILRHLATSVLHDHNESLIPNSLELAQ